MLDTQTIHTLALINELVEPASEEEKFRNSDKRWSEVTLGKNPEACKTAFLATMVAIENLSELSVSN